MHASTGVLLPTQPARDLNSRFRSRLESVTDRASIGFYDRSTRVWTTRTQPEFLRRAATVGVELESKGIRSGQHVMIACASPEAILLAFIGAVFAGAIPTVLPLRAAFDSREAIVNRIRDTHTLLGPQTAIVIEEKNGRLIAPETAGITTVRLNSQQVIEIANLGLLPVAETSKISHIQLTSGSTGMGKGVAVTHQSTLANIDALRERIAITPYDVFISWLPLYHDMGLISKALLPLVLGIDTYMMSPFDFLADPTSWVEAISKHRGSVSASPTFGYDLVTKRVTDEHLSTLDLSTWKSAYCGAEPIRAEVTRAFYERFASCGLSPTAFTPSYGLAEATLAVTGTRTQDPWRSITVSRSSLTRLDRIELSDDPNNSVEVVACGTPVDGLSVGILASDGNVTQDELVCGEVVVNGPSVAGGWLDQGGAITNFASDGLHTGDIGFLQGGELFVIDRIKNIVIRNGQNYSSQMLEHALARATSVEPENVLVLDRDITNGSGLTGIIEIDPKTDCDRYVQAVSAQIEQFEPPLEQLVFIKFGSLPRTTSGKKRHIAVREALNAGTLPIISKHEMVVVASTATTVDVEDSLAALQRADSLITLDGTEEEQHMLELVAGHVRARGLDVPVVMTSRLKHDLDFDSLGLLDLSMHVEDAFGTGLSREILAEVKTVADLLDAVRLAKSSDTTKESLAERLRVLKSQVPQYYTVIDEVGPNRQIRVDGRWMHDFAASGYLGLADDESMIEAVNELHKKWGALRWPSRAIGLPRPVLDLEKRVADLVGVPDTMLFATITLLHIGVLPLLAGTNGAIIADMAAHKSMQEAALLARSKGASVSSFKHDDLADLEDRLKRTQHHSRRIVVLDGVYSMLGTVLDVKPYQELAKRYDALLYIDDAHGFGVFGENPTAETPYGSRGNGVVNFAGCNFDNIVYVCGLGKAYSAEVGFVSCPTPEYRELFHAATTSIFGHLASTAAIAQVQTALDLNEKRGDRLRKRLRGLSKQLIEGARNLGFEVDSHTSPIVNVIVGDVESVVIATNVLWDDNIKITPAVFPAAPLDRGGLRFTVTASHTPAQINEVLASLARLKSMLNQPQAKLNTHA